MSLLLTNDTLYIILILQFIRKIGRYVNKAASREGGYSRKGWPQNDAGFGVEKGGYALLFFAV